eukprot:CAMPEP_0118975482 /NCGR_PEP_ID=MMETSP1173-20130426/15891_1 /TAXON_ID=1034831 /ORGANISM="Rhizochromulina marina cf, Strain CCMP1243" /LENGTH=324 /DNA_ID=CAMNT_0006925365 /DNA_START=106 /DNA_END=1080 /DNA_ORIENTATION=-
MQIEIRQHEASTGSRPPLAPTVRARRKSRAPRPTHTKFERWLVIVVNSNALVQFVADLVLEVMHIIPRRINHLSLTFLNAFIAFKTLSAVHKGKFQFLHEDVQFLFLMEICLITGDVYYMIKDDFPKTFIYIRAAFIFFSLFNWVSCVYFMWRYNLWHLTYQGGHDHHIHPMAALRSLGSFFHHRDDLHHDSHITPMAALRSLGSFFHHHRDDGGDQSHPPCTEDGHDGKAGQPVRDVELPAYLGLDVPGKAETNEAKEGAGPHEHSDMDVVLEEKELTATGHGRERSMSERSLCLRPDFGAQSDSDVGDSDTDAEDAGEEASS